MLRCLQSKPFSIIYGANTFSYFYSINRECPPIKRRGQKIQGGCIFFVIRFRRGCSEFCHANKGEGSQIFVTRETQNQINKTPQTAKTPYISITGCFSQGGVYKFVHSSQGVCSDLGGGAPTFVTAKFTDVIPPTPYWYTHSIISHTHIHTHTHNLGSNTFLSTTKDLYELLCHRRYVLFRRGTWRSDLVLSDIDKNMVVVS